MCRPRLSGKRLKYTPSYWTILKVCTLCRTCGCRTPNPPPPYPILTDHVDDTADALTTESKRANEVREKAASCGMYICVAVEFLVLMILIVIVAMG